jgi:hypothetical protein
LNPVGWRGAASPGIAPVSSPFVSFDNEEEDTEAEDKEEEEEVEEEVEAEEDEEEEGKEGLPRPPTT